MRPEPENASQVSCVPYDVVYESEAREIINENPLSFLRITRAEAEFAVGENTTPDEIYGLARKNLREFIDKHIFVTETEPSLYVYRLISGEHTQTGIIGGCSIDEYESGAIKKHEKVRPDKVADRTAHLLALGAQTGLIFLAFRGTETIRSLIAETVTGAPLYDFVCSGGIRHTIWRVTKTNDLIDAFAAVPALYIADGHHRAESAMLARNRLRSENPNHTGTEEYNYVMAGIFPAEDLSIMAYNRVVHDLNGLSRDEYFAKLQENFIVGETDDKEPENHGDICMYMAGQWHKLSFNVRYIREPDPIERLDVSILQRFILEPILGITDPRTDTRIGFVGGGRGTSELEKMVDSGEYVVAFSMFPTTMDELFAVSDMNEIMPPKSTWFEPKLRDGLIVHII